MNLINHYVFRGFDGNIKCKGCGNNAHIKTSHDSHGRDEYYDYMCNCEYSEHVVKITEVKKQLHWLEHNLFFKEHAFKQHVEQRKEILLQLNTIDRKIMYNNNH